MHARRVVPEEERLALALGLVHEALGVLDQHLVEGRHVVFGALQTLLHVRHVGHVRVGRQRAFVDDPLLADLAPARHHRLVVVVGRPAVHQVARPVLGMEGWIPGEGVPVGIRHGVEVVEIAEELIEAVQRRQELVEVAEVVLAELAGGIALRLERGGNGASLGRHADVGAGLADGRQPRAQGDLAGDEGGPARRAAGFGVVVGEQHALRGQLVEVRRLAGHHAAVVGADVEPADVVAHDEHDVGPLPSARRRCRRLLLGLRRIGQGRLPPRPTPPPASRRSAADRVASIRAAATFGDCRAICRSWLFSLPASECPSQARPSHGRMRAVACRGESVSCTRGERTRDRTRNRRPRKT